MTYENPTKLHIGMQGQFGGKHFRLVGRVVMGVEIEGETYTWNEFNLKTDDGVFVILVFEGDGEGDGTWRLFNQFEPEYPMTAADAATKKVGDSLNLTDTPVRVTLVQSSRVYRISGVAPEGVTVGSVANYFNAEAGHVMQVVSWTGEEVEYFNGLTLSADDVSSAFDLDGPPLAKPDWDSGSSGWSNSGQTNANVKTLFRVAIVVVLVMIAFFSCHPGNHEAAPVVKRPAPVLALSIGDTGIWNQKKLTVIAHAIFEIDQVGAIYDQNEYILADEQNNHFLLICGTPSDTKDWLLLSPQDVLSSPSPETEAAEKMGDTINQAGFTGTIQSIFESTIQSTENLDYPLWRTGDVTYDFLARSSNQVLLARWNNDVAISYVGTSIVAHDFAAAFSAPSKP